MQSKRFNTYVLVFVAAITFVFAQLNSSPTLSLRQQSCDEAPEWALAPEAYNEAGTDQQVANLLSEALRIGIRFDQALGNALGIENFKCGIGLEESCQVSSCFEYQAAGIEPWLYFTAVSVSNMNAMLNVIYNGISIAQIDFQSLTDDLADHFFQWKDPLYLGTAIAYAVDATITAICTFGVAAAKNAPKVGATLQGLTPFGGAAASSVASYLQPLSGQTRESGIRNLNTLAFNFSNTARTAIEGLADHIFAGSNDPASNNILHYLHSATFLDSDIIPPQTSVEDFYRTSFVARIVNALWLEGPVYIVSTTAKSGELSSYPSNESYYNPVTSRTYTPYYYTNKQVQPLPHIASLDNTLYNITPSYVASAAGRAWEIAGFDYTSTTAINRLTDAFANSTLTPFQDGAGWEGVFTLPVCDISDQPTWVVEYGSHTLPCCCGHQCADTHKFIELTHLNHTWQWRDQCKSQLKDTNLNFDSIDYGITGGGFWASLSKGLKVVFCFGIVGGFLFVGLCLLCCIGCCLY